MSRLGEFLVGIAIFAFLLCGLFAAISLVFRLFDLRTGQLLAGAVCEILLHTMFLALGLKAFESLQDLVRHSNDRIWLRIITGVSLLTCGLCWTSIGLRGIVQPEILMAFLNR